MNKEMCLLGKLKTVFGMRKIFRGGNMRISRIIILILIGLMFMSVPCFAGNWEEGYRSYSVSFEQDGRIVNPIGPGHVVNLQKRDFNIIIAFSGFRGDPVAVRLNTSVNDHYYSIARSGGIVADLLGEGLGMAEPVNFLPEIILTNDNAVQYFDIYSTGSRFNETRITGNTIYGKRYIREVTFRGNNSDISIKNLMVNEIYLVFIKSGSTGVQQEYYMIQFPKPEFPTQQLTAEQWLQQGIAFEQQNDLGSAIEAYNEALTLNPQYYESYLYRGAVFLKLGKFNEAMADFNTAVSIRPQATDAYYGLAYLYTISQNWQFAIDDYSKIIAINPNSSLAYFRRGSLIYSIYRNSAEKDKLRAATADFSMFIQLEPTKVDGYVARADTYFALGKYDKAEIDYTQAINMEPNTSYYEKRSQCYEWTNNWEKDLEDCNKLVELNPQNPGVYLYRAGTEERLSNYNLAIMDYSKVLEISQGQHSVRNIIGFPVDFWEIYNSRGQDYRSNKQPDKAIADFTMAISLTSNNIYYYHRRAAAYLENGEYDKAIADSTRVINVDNYTWAYLIRGKAYEAKGMRQEALNDFNKAINLDPKFTEAIKERDALLKG